MCTSWHGLYGLHGWHGLMKIQFNNGLARPVRSGDKILIVWHGPVTKNKTNFFADRTVPALDEP